MRPVHVDVFHLVDVASRGLVPHLQIAAAPVGYAQPTGARAAGGGDVEIPPSGEGVRILLGERRHEKRGSQH